MSQVSVESHEYAKAKAKAKPADRWQPRIPTSPSSQRTTTTASRGQNRRCSGLTGHCLARQGLKTTHTSGQQPQQQRGRTSSSIDSQKRLYPPSASPTIRFVQNKAPYLSVYSSILEQSDKWHVGPLQHRFWAIYVAIVVHCDKGKAGMHGCRRCTERQTPTIASSQLATVNPVELDSLFEP
ncbi:hypothetical protein V6N13_096984 [Hibiscus sabdariffa]|uniref:Uncharacterized protein n=1 Tax=Hibiscus sabdariffa TaxID=183260 RepID=A0ABR2BZB9_9ROSI